MNLQIKEGMKMKVFKNGVEREVAESRAQEFREKGYSIAGEETEEGKEREYKRKIRELEKRIKELEKKGTEDNGKTETT